MREPIEYLENWDIFRKHCENRAKVAECHINNKNWQKLKEYHLDGYLKSINNPYGFLFNIRFYYKNIWRQVYCMPKYYHKYLRLRQKEFDSPARNMVEFPTWRKK